MKHVKKARLKTNPCEIVNHLRAFSSNLWPFFIPTPRALRTARRHGMSEFWFPWNTCSQILHSSLPLFRPTALKFLLNERREKEATRRRVKKGFLQVIRSSKVAVCKLTLSQSFDKSLSFTLHQEKFSSLRCLVILNCLRTWFNSLSLFFESLLELLSEVSQNSLKKKTLASFFRTGSFRPCANPAFSNFLSNNETIMRVIKTFSKVNFLRGEDQVSLVRY